MTSRMPFAALAFLLGFGCLVVLAAPPKGKDKDKDKDKEKDKALLVALEKAEKDGLRLIAKEWLALGKSCVDKKLGSEAKTCADRVAAVDDTVEGFKTLRERADACEDAATDVEKQTWPKNEAAAKKKVAGLYDKLYHLADKVTDSKIQERYEVYLWTALGLDPDEKRWGVLVGMASAAAGAKDPDKAARIAGKALAQSPPEKVVPSFKRVLDAAATDGMILRTCSAHPMKYYLSLPRGFERKKDKKWPIVVCVDGAGSNFKGIAQGYQGSRSSLPFIIASPCTFANTNAIEGDAIKKYQQWYSDDVINEGKDKRIGWDEEGILCMIKDLVNEYDAESRVYVTGFSGGGNATYMMTFKHPDLVNGSAPACGNFANYGYSESKGKFTPEDLNFPVHQITGEKDEHRDFTFGNKDSPGIEPQTDGAAALLKDFGYPNVKRTMVPGMGHSSAIDLVIATFKPYIEGVKKRSDKLE